MKVCWGLVLLCGLSACAEPEATDLKEPGAEGPLHMTIWDLEDNSKTNVEADKLDLVGSDLSKMHLHGPKIRMPLLNGYLWLATKEAWLDQGREQSIEIKDIIYLEGVVDGRPLKGTAQSLHLQSNKKHCDLEDADFIWGKQHVTAKVLRLRSGSVLEGEQWKETPLTNSPAASE